MKLITYSHRPSTFCSVTQICLPQFSIFEPPYSASYCTHINTLIPDHHKWLAFICEFQLEELFLRIRIQ